MLDIYIFLLGIRRLQDNIVSFNLKVELRWPIDHFVLVRQKYFWKAENKIDRGKGTADSDKRYRGF